MISLVSDKLNEIRQACEEMNIKSLYLFGSGARNNDFTTESDLDFLYTSLTDEEGYLLPPYYDYFDVLQRLKTITGREIDLVAEKKIKNKYFLEQVLKDRIQLYEHRS